MIVENRSGLLPIEPDPRTYTIAEFLELLRTADVDEPTFTRVSDALREYFAALEHKAVFKAHVKSQMAARASRDGETGGRLPLGYQRVRGTGVAIDEDGATTVRHIFHMKTRGFSLRGIAKQLNAERIPTSYGGKKWAASAVSQIINHEDMYRGAPRKDSPLCWPVILTPDLSLDEPLSRVKTQATIWPFEPASGEALDIPDGENVSTQPASVPVPRDLSTGGQELGRVTASQPQPAVSDPNEPPKVFTPSRYQQAIFDFIASGSGDGLVNAVAGSGKTSTLEQAAKLLPRGKRALFLAFNKKIADELSGRLRGTTMAAKTIHSVGYQCVAAVLKTMLPHFQRLEPDKHARKYHRICCDVFYATMPNTMQVDDQRSALSALEEIVKFARLTLTDGWDANALAELVDHFGIELDPFYQEAMLAMVPDVLATGMHQAETEGACDFTDMVWLPHVWKLQPPEQDFVFVDECQDLNAAQLDLVLKCRVPGGRMLFVGDSQQAVYGFSGADAESFWKIQQRTGAQVLPLSICYRCPRRHIVELAQSLVPQIEPAPWAKDGIIETMSDDQALGILAPSDLVICRLTAPCIEMCIRLIRNRRGARVEGKEIEKQLTDLVQAIAEMDGFTYPRFSAFLQRYHEAQEQRLQQRGDSASAMIESLADRVSAVQALYDGFPQVQDVDALCWEIKKLFNEQTGVVTLSTVHRAKGLENPRIFILRPDKLPLVWSGQRDWEYEQERNLQYVAYTRAKEALYFIESDK